jgi:hypothetical protein
MTFQSINLGLEPNDGTGDDLRTAGGKINANFDALFGKIAWPRPRSPASCRPRTRRSSTRR